MSLLSLSDEAVPTEVDLSGRERQWPPFSIAFQPIVDTDKQKVIAYEALVRRADGGPAHEVLSAIPKESRYSFDQACRTRAIQVASRVGILEQGVHLSVNLMPGCIYDPAGCVRATFDAAAEVQFPLDKLILEITEEEQADAPQARLALTAFRKMGISVAIDDFGAGYSTLSLFAELEVDIVKVDARLIRGLHKNRRAATIIGAMLSLCSELGVRIVAEAVETENECRALQDLGVTLMQGYFFARPKLEELPRVRWDH